MAKREPKSPTAGERLLAKTINVLTGCFQTRNFHANAMLTEDNKTIIVSVQTYGELAPKGQKKIARRIQKVIRHLKLSIHFVDQSPYHKPAPS